MRPLWWIYREQIRKGKEYFFDMPEVRMKGYFQVLEITPLKNTSFKNATNTQTVIGKFGHQDAFIWNLYFEGNPEPLGVTNVHPFYSVERQKWVQAGELYIGELVQAKDANLKLVGKKRLEGKHQVFNLEVHQIHNYFVSKQKILTHNNEPCNEIMFEDPNNPSNAIIGTLDEKGILTTALESKGENRMPGSVLFGKVFDHFGEEKVKFIRGAWTYGDNLKTFNKETGINGLSIEKAAKKTFTGKMAARRGYEKFSIESTKGTPGNYTKVYVLFGK